MKVSLALFLIGLTATGCQTFDPTSAYKEETIQGFTFLFSPKVLHQKAKAAEIRQEIEQQLKNIQCVVPAQQLDRLRTLRTWVEWTSPLDVGATFHPGADWLRKRRYNPDKLGEVEIADTNKFLKDSSDHQPWLLLHEFAHAYHFHVLGYTHGGILTAFNSASKGGLYDDVCHLNGTKGKAYAVNNEREYFAELTEAYFGLNDYFPFTRKQLESHDPDGHKLLSDLWGEPSENPTSCRQALPTRRVWPAGC